MSLRSNVLMLLNSSSMVLLLVPVFVDDVLEKCEQWLLAALVPGLHETSVALAGGWATPAKVIHLIGPIFLILLADGAVIT